MKSYFIKIVSVVLCFSMLFCVNASAVDTQSVSVQSESVGDTVMKGLYNALNVIVEGLVSTICKIYPDSSNWQNIDDYDRAEVGFMPGRENYQTEAARSNYWTLGYSSKSLVPEDIDNGKYNIGRDLTNKLAQGVYDDMRIRVAVIDDNSGEGAVVLGAIDALGVTSTDIRAMRKVVLEYCMEQKIKVSSINIVSTHAHSALDTQGVSTGFVNKLFGAFWTNIFGIDSPLPGLETAEYFKNYFIGESVKAIKEAFENRESGKLYFSTADFSEYIKDKRELIAKEDLPETAVLRFVPDSGKGDTYIADITCHATSFSAGHNLVGSDYIYYMDKYIKDEVGGNFIMIPGAVGQVSRDISVNTEGMTEWEDWGAEANYLGTAFAKLVLAADYTELAPVINAVHRDIFVKPENSILVLACEIGLVNNRVYYDGFLFKEYMMATEMGYLEFGNKVGFALFPGELYPETFWDDEITGAANWDGTEWQYDSLFESVDGVDVYCVSLANDAIGYVLTDNNFAFMGHIIGDGIADEVLSVGKHIGSFLVGEYLEMIKGIK